MITRLHCRRLILLCAFCLAPLYPCAHAQSVRSSGGFDAAPSSSGRNTWLAQVASGLEEGRPAPALSPSNLHTNARVIEPDVPDSLYRGTYFDARITTRIAQSYPTFEEASARIAAPMTFLGVSQEVTELVKLLGDS